MSPTLIATIAGLMTAFCWGTGDWLAAKSAKKLSAIQVDFVVSCLGLVVAGILLLFTDLHMPTGRQLLIVAASSTLITIAYLLFVKALSTGVVGIIVPIGNSYPFVTVVLSAAFLSVSLTFGEVGAMAGIVVGGALLAYQNNHKKIPLRELHQELMLAIGAAIVWGAAFFVLNAVVDELSWQMLTISGAAFSILATLPIFLAVYRTRAVSAAKQALASKPALIAGTIGSIGMVTFYVGSDYGGSTVIPTVLSAAGPLVASIWGAAVDHERLGALKRAGAVMIVAGIIVLNIA